MSSDRPAHTCGARKGAGRALAIGCPGGGRGGSSTREEKGRRRPFLLGPHRIGRRRRWGGPGGALSGAPRLGWLRAKRRRGQAVARGRGPEERFPQVRRPRCAARVPPDGLTSALVVPETLGGASADSQPAAARTMDGGSEAAPATAAGAEEWRCRGCGDGIAAGQRLYRTVNEAWHVSCFRCAWRCPGRTLTQRFERVLRWPA
ncbi:hypothetical protein lerEdw1_019481 [Lerista edwardsae]|nr:hypothetical protein lerEdw1_019481 [Lerista edwardsae]